MNLEDIDVEPVIQLTEEQTKAVELILNWMKQPFPLEFRLGGFAGTGKTTIIKSIREALKDKFVTKLAAFTGKACNVLHRKGLTDACTIHSLIYNAEPQVNGGVIFYKKNKLENNPNLVIIDEASMISTELYNDLKYFKTKLLFVGDPGQLEPVGDNPNLMAKPDYVLEKIHRQAELSPIITFSQHIRNGGLIENWTNTSEELNIRDKVEFKISQCLAFDQVICAKNRTKKTTNERFRTHMGKSQSHLCTEDKIIVLRNNPEFMVFNGMILFIDVVVEDRKLYTIVHAHDEIGRSFPGLKIWNEPFEKEMPTEFKIPKDKDNHYLVYADWGYCITCHKSQGSEWDNVLVWDEWMPPKLWDMKRWRYTAITRAAKRLTFCK